MQQIQQETFLLQLSKVVVEDLESFLLQLSKVAVAAKDGGDGGGWGRGRGLGQANADNIYAIPGSFNFNDYQPSSAEANVEEGGEEAEEEKEGEDGSNAQDHYFEDNHEDINNVTLHGIPRFDLKPPQVQTMQSYGHSTDDSTASFVWENTTTNQHAATPTSFTSQPFNVSLFHNNYTADSQDILQYAGTPPSLSQLFTHPTAELPRDSFEFDPFDTTPLTSDFLQPLSQTAYPADLSSRPENHASPLWLSQEQAAQMPLQLPVSQQIAPPSHTHALEPSHQQAALQTSRPQATRSTSAPMLPGFVASTSVVDSSVVDRRLEATGILTVGCKLPAPEALLALSALHLNNEDLSPTTSSLMGHTVQGPNSRNRQVRSITSSHSTVASSTGTGLNNDEREVAPIANVFIQRKIMTIDPWPTLSSLKVLLTKGIEFANRRKEAGHEPLQPTKSILRYLAHSASSARTPFRKNAIALVPIILDLHPPPGCTDANYMVRLAEEFLKKGNHLWEGYDKYIEFALKRITTGLNLFSGENYTHIYEKYMGIMHEYTWNPDSYLAEQFREAQEALSALGRLFGSNSMESSSHDSSDSLLRSNLVPTPVVPDGWVAKPYNDNGDDR
ncbi:hypothetical protein DXG01_010819 [Tephrocybe rancida]|nr:hypothetical protein DXG01_010819 [Tephrocybe rancida]